MRAAARHLRLLVALAALTSPLAAWADSVAEDERTALKQFLERTLTGSHSFDDRFHAEVWLLDMSGRLAQFVEAQEQRLALLEAVHFYAKEADLPPELVLSVIEVESHFKRFALSRSGAQGLMQVMPFWREELGRPNDNLTDIHTNLSYGCRILQFYLQQEQGRLRTALARYNGSAGSDRYPDKVEQAWRAHWRTETLNWD